MKKLLSFMSIVLICSMILSNTLFATDTKLTQNNNIITFVQDFSKNDDSSMAINNNYTNGGSFDCTWRRENITFQNGIMSLSIDKDGVNSSPQYSGGSCKTSGYYHYGLYEVSMKPIKNDGVVSSFFVYTGPSDGNDEIDIEFLGKDTTKVQLNYFTDGEGHHSYLHDLAFDASEEFHEYGFDWSADSITWYVDGIAVYQATSNVPKRAGKISMNVWPGKGVDKWLNPFDGTVPLAAEYDWLRFTGIKGVNPDGEKFVNVYPGDGKEFHFNHGWYERYKYDFLITDELGTTTITYNKKPDEKYVPIYVPMEGRFSDFNYLVLVMQGEIGDKMLVSLKKGSDLVVLNKTVILTGNTDYILLDISNKHDMDELIDTLEEVAVFPSSGAAKSGKIIIRDIYFTANRPNILDMK